MRRAGALIALAALAAALAGCQSLSAGDCRTGDWRALGREDGARGARPAEMERHRAACAKHGATLDGEQYQAGYAEGLKAYCTPAGGYVAGRRGDGYHDVCRKGGAEPQFLEAYRHGQQVFRLHREVKDLRRRAEDVQYAAMMEEGAPEDRTNLRFQAEQWDERATLKQWDLEHLDRKYCAQYGAKPLGWSEIRAR